MWCEIVTVHWHMSLLNVPSNSIVSLYSRPRRPLWRPPYRLRSQTEVVSLVQPKESVPPNIRHILTPLPQRPIRSKQTHMWIDVETIVGLQSSPLAQFVLTLFFCLGFLVWYGSLQWPLHVKIFPTSFGSIKMPKTH